MKLIKKPWVIFAVVLIVVALGEFYVLKMTHVFCTPSAYLTRHPQSHSYGMPDVEGHHLREGLFYFTHPDQVHIEPVYGTLKRWSGLVRVTFKMASADPEKQYVYSDTFPVVTESEYSLLGWKRTDLRREKLKILDEKLNKAKNASQAIVLNYMSPFWLSTSGYLGENTDLSEFLLTEDEFLYRSSKFVDKKHEIARQMEGALANLEQTLRRIALKEPLTDVHQTAIEAWSFE